MKLPTIALFAVTLASLSSLFADALGFEAVEMDLNTNIPCQQESGLVELSSEECMEFADSKNLSFSAQPFDLGLYPSGCSEYDYEDMNFVVFNPNGTGVAGTASAKICKESETHADALGFEPLYMGFNYNDCQQSEYVELSYEECVDVARFPVAKGNDATYPKGCYEHFMGGYYFNYHATGMGHGEADKICKESETHDSSNTAIGSYNVTRNGLSVENAGNSSTVKNIFIKYNFTSMNEANYANATIFDPSCENEIETFPSNSTTVGDAFNLVLMYDPSRVEGDGSIWTNTTNRAGVVTGGTFGFCVRVDLWSRAHIWSIYFLQTKFNATVDKTQGIDTLTINVDRTEATNETVTNVDYDAELQASKCDVETKIENTDPVSQGSVLGICVTSQTSGIEVVGWQDLTLKNSEDLVFPAIADGSISTGLNNLVTEDCNIDNWCTAQVQLVSGFFTEDGSFNATGTVILGLSGTRRQLEMATDTDTQRTLEEEGGSGTFEISIEMDSPVSAASSMNAPHLQIITFALVSLLAFALY